MLHLFSKRLALSINNGDELLPLPAGKRAVNVLVDFIMYVFGRTKTYIQERHLTLKWSEHEDIIEYILTHPND